VTTLRRELEELREKLTDHLQLPQPPDGKDAASKPDGSERRFQTAGLNGWGYCCNGRIETRYGDLVHKSPHTQGRVECT